MALPIQSSASSFDADLVVLGVVAQLLAGLFLSAAAGRGRSKHMLLEALGGMPRNLDFLRDALHARVRGQAGAIFLLAGSALLLAGFLIPGPSDWKVRAGGMLLELVVAGAFVASSEGYVRRTLRRYIRHHVMQNPFAFEDHINLTREIGEIFGVPSTGDDTLESYIAKVKSAVGVGSMGPGIPRRPSTRAALR